MAHQEKEASDSEAEFKSPENRLCSGKSERTMEECAISKLSLECMVVSPYSHVPNEMCTTDGVTKAGNSEMVEQHTAIERKNSARSLKRVLTNPQARQPTVQATLKSFRE